MTNNNNLQQANRFLLCAMLTGFALYYARVVLIPLTFSVFLAMLFAPLSTKLENLGVNRAFSSLFSILLLVLTISAVCLLIYFQSKKLVAEYPEIEKKTAAFLEKAENYVNTRLDISESRQKQLIQDQLKSGAAGVGKVLKDLVAGVFSLAASIVLVLIFTFLFLYQREKYERFFIRICKHLPPEEAKKTLERISRVSKNYVTGRFLSILIFTVLFTVGFLIVGLHNAFLLAFIAALLTIVPYVGSIVGGLFPFAVALVTEDSFNTAIGALAVIVIIQAIDNYFIEPYIIGGEVNISAFFTIFILFVGGLLWGVAGMILFLPMLGVFKIVCDQVPALHPYADLVGDQQNEKQSTRLFRKIKKMFQK